MPYYFPIFSSSAGTAEVLLKAARPTPMVYFMAFWLLFWTLGGVAAGSQWLGGGAGSEEHTFLSLWLLGWVVGEVTVGAQLLWYLAGQELVTLAGGVLRIRQQAGFLHREKAYDTRHIRHLRAQDNELPEGFNRQRWPFGQGAVLFDYGARTVRFGGGLPEYEGQQVVEFLRQHGLDPAQS